MMQQEEEVEEEKREEESKRKVGGRGPSCEAQASFSLYLPLCSGAMARAASPVRDRKLVKSGGQRVELSVALSVAGFIRSEGGIYVGPSVIYRFRWHTRYRYTDIDTSLVRARQSSPPLRSFPLFLHAYILLYYWTFLSFFIF